MSQTSYTSRPFRPGDEDDINQLYLQITGRTRSREQWFWQWQSAPGGKGDIWLIEANSPNGNVELVGHHGIMPVRFTFGQQDLLFGKTENTMVLPSHRRNMLYPRFERKFMGAYEGRYHALFSTMGPAAAIRQRAALGYVAEKHWASFEHAVSPLASLARIAGSGRTRHLQNLGSAIFRPKPTAALPEGVEFVDGEVASRDSFFSKFWSRCREQWGIAPRRDAEDLAWRYWDNPYSDHHAVVVRLPGVGTGIAILEQKVPGTVAIVDIFGDNIDPKLLKSVMERAIMAASRRLGAALVTFRMTEDAFAPDAVAALASIFHPSLATRLFARRNAVGAAMPRKITPKGAAANICSAPWSITMAVAEGRR